MITLKVLKVYREHSGEYDMIERMGTPDERKALSDPGWMQIENLLWGLSMIKSELAHPGLVSKIQKDMLDLVDCDESRIILQEMAVDTRQIKAKRRFQK